MKADPWGDTDADFAPPEVPLRAIIISIATLAIPVFASFFAPEWMTEDDGMLVWLTALLPAFLFAYYKGWRGVSIALAAGMAVLTAVHVAIVALDLSSPDWSLLLGVVIVYVGTCLGLGFFADLLHRARHEAAHQALTDALTDLPNRRHAMLVLARAVAAASRGTPFCVALFDLDDFKGFNDRYGHVAGDQVLQAFANILKHHTRQMDLSARFGGEEFLSVLVDNTQEGAFVFANRVREGLKAVTLPGGQVTVSCSVASYCPEMDTIQDLIVTADEALYQAKRAGRDRVVLADNPVVA